MARSGSASSAVGRRAARAARPRGGAPSARRAARRRCAMPRSTHSCITAQMCSRPARTSASVRQDSSLASMTSLIGSPVSRACAEQLVRRCGTGSGTGVRVRDDHRVARPRPRRARSRRRPSSTRAGRSSTSRRRPGRGTRMPLVWKSQPLAAVQHDVVVDGERDRVLAGQPQHAVARGRASTRGSAASGRPARAARPPARAPPP